MKRGFAVIALLVALGCGGSMGHPDTGAGANQPVPPTENCADLCARLGSCVVTLCNEDTMSTRYNGLDTLLSDECAAGCTDAQIMSGLTSTQWTCLFQSSCRQVFEYDTCHQMGHYNCS